VVLLNNKKVKRLIKLLKQSISYNKQIQSKKQRTFVYCKCGNEINREDDSSFIRDVYIKERNVIHYKCSKCGTESFFDFDYPCPIPLPFTEKDDIIEQYRLIYYNCK